ncbi:hypothetical protein ABDK00_014565 [Niabella insulamsoli]|uniref:hypothetical protein n=1 Tax=Niabella insulamsoli TaxID=3144874 RepID=UPI0031FE1781
MLRLKKSLRLFACLTFTSFFISNSEAQIKVGSNPTTVSANTNFEVEATNGSKTVVKQDNGNVGIGTTGGAADNKLHVKATSDPLKLEGLVPVSPTESKAGTLVADANGVVKLETANVKSAVSVNGTNFTLPNSVWTNLSGTDIKHYDNLSEYSGGVFTPKKDGLYDIKAIVGFPQSDVAGDDGFLGFVAVHPSVALSSGQGQIWTSAKVSIPEAGIGPAVIYVLCSATYKLKANEPLRIRAAINGGPNGRSNYTYNVQITRLD